MADIFTKDQALHLLKNKFILLMGDSNTRALYNDLIYLLHVNDISPPILFRQHSSKNNKCAVDLDRILKRSPVEDATRHVKEIREYSGLEGVVVRFCFVTRVLGDQVQDQLREIEEGVVSIPDIIIMNSCVWDLMRWGAMQEGTYKQQLICLFTRLRLLLPPSALVIWTTALPSAETKVRGGYVIKQLEFIQRNMGFITLEANLFVAELCKLYCFDLLDLRYHMRFQLSRRCGDGMHWETHAMRQITCLLLTHIALSYGAPLPGRLPSGYLSAAVRVASEACQDDSVRLNASVLSTVQRELESATSEVLSKESCQGGDTRRKMRCRRFNTGSAPRRLKEPSTAATRTDDGNRSLSLDMKNSISSGSRLIGVQWPAETHDIVESWDNSVAECTVKYEGRGTRPQIRNRSQSPMRNSASISGNRSKSKSRPVSLTRQTGEPENLRLSAGLKERLTSSVSLSDMRGHVSGANTGNVDIIVRNDRVGERSLDVLPRLRSSAPDLLKNVNEKDICMQPRPAYSTGCPQPDRRSPLLMNPSPRNVTHDCTGTNDGRPVFKSIAECSRYKFNFNLPCDGKFDSSLNAAITSNVLLTSLNFEAPVTAGAEWPFRPRVNTDFSHRSVDGPVSFNFHNKPVAYSDSHVYGQRLFNTHQANVTYPPKYGKQPFLSRSSAGFCDLSASAQSSSLQNTGASTAFSSSAQLSFGLLPSNADRRWHPNTSYDKNSFNCYDFRK